MSVVRLRLDLAYDGTDFHGWAAQDGTDLRTVAGELQEWLRRVLRDPSLALVCAGRTDTGVHARGQVAHLDIETDTAPEALARDLQRRLARVLPDDIVVNSVRVAPPGFDARFAAVWRRYTYRLSDSPAPDPLVRTQVVRVPGPLDLQAMDAAGAALLGLHDFAAYCKRRDGATTIRTLLSCSTARVVGGPLDGVVEVGVRADAFCHSMVRSLVGALVTVGQGRREPAWPAAQLLLRERSGSVTVMPPHGLVLEEVGYPPDADLAARVEQARRRRDDECPDCLQGEQP